jgi:hypothetical protein
MARTSGIAPMGKAEQRSSERAAIMVSEALRFLSASGKAGAISARCARPPRRLNLTFTRL